MKTLVKMNFNPEIAGDVGTDAAIILENIAFWIGKNADNQAGKENKTSFHKGDWWTFNSVEAFSRQFCWLSPKQIETRLKILEEKGYIKTGNFNKVKYDRTKWYALGENPFIQEVKSIYPNGEMEFTKQGNRINQTGEPIPNNNPNDKREGTPPYFSSELYRNFSQKDQLQLLQSIMGIYEPIDFGAISIRVKNSKSRGNVLETVYHWWYQDIHEGKLGSNKYIANEEAVYVDDVPKSFDEAKRLMDERLEAKEKLEPGFISNHNLDSKKYDI